MLVILSLTLLGVIVGNEGKRKLRGNTIGYFLGIPFLHDCQKKPRVIIPGFLYNVWIYFRETNR